MAHSRERQPTEDGHHVVVNGRRWRATDPSIPTALRDELVNELMSARRTVQHARSEADQKAARQRVHDAKVALGERGHPWWIDASPAQRRVRIDAAMRTLLAHRGVNSSICPSDVARVVDGRSWQALMTEVRCAAVDAARRGEVRVTAGGAELDPQEPFGGPVRIRLRHEGSSRS
jgi:hypothetical protein